MSGRTDPPWRRLAEAASRGQDPASSTVATEVSPPDDAPRSASHRSAAAAHPPDAGRLSTLRGGDRRAGAGRDAVQRKGRARAADRRWDLRLAAPAAVIWAGTAAGVTAPGPAGGAAAVLAAAGLVAVTVAALSARATTARATTSRGRGACRGRRAPLVAGAPRAGGGCPRLVLVVATLALLASAALGTGRMAHDLQRAGPIGAALAGRSLISGDLLVRDEPRSLGGEDGPDRQQGASLVRGTVISATVAGSRVSAAMPVLVLGDQRWMGVRPGQTVRVDGRLAPTEPGSREAAFLNANAPPRPVAAPPPPDDVAATIRARLREQSAAQSPDAGQLIPGLVLGDRAPLGDDLRAAMMAASLTHLTAVSGTNCTIVLGCVLGLGVVLRLPRWALLPGAVVALAGFVVVVGPDPSVLRAAVMGAVGTVAVVSGRGRAPSAMLATAVGALLLIDPYLATALGFALSVVATAALVALCGPIGDALTVLLPTSWATQLPGAAVRLLAAPAAAQAACAPLLVLVQPVVSTWGVMANALVAPLVPVVTVAGSAAVLLGAAWAPLAVVPLWVAARCTDAVAAVARLVADAPAALLPWPAGLPGMLLLAVADALAVGAILLVAARRRRSHRTLTARCRTGSRVGPKRAAPPRSAGRPPQRRGRWEPAWTGSRAMVRAGVVVGGVAVVAAGTAAFTVSTPAWPGQWQLAMCDVGQGDGLVLRVDAATAVLVDSGPPGPSMARCLDRLGVHRLAAVILTHQHDDHYGGLPEALQGRTPDRLLVSAAEPSLAPAVDALLRRAPVPVERLLAPGRGRIGAVSWSVLWPRTPRPIGDENDNSVVLHVELAPADGPPLRVLLTGDLEENGVAALLRAPGAGDGLREVDVIKVAHHGARNGGTALQDAVRAPLALISVGRDNDYGHPAPGVLDHLRGLGATVWRTDQQGGVTVRRTRDRVVATALPP